MKSGFTVDLIAGARPNFMKVAPIIEALRVACTRGSRLRYRLVHTGQHSDFAMSGEFFHQLGIPDPHIELQATGDSHAELTADIMIRYEKVLLERPCDLCLVVGDVTSTMACAIVARKLGVPVAHVEAGIRSGDWSMPEEVNRVVTDSIANWFFTTTQLAGDNLLRTGASPDSVFFVGNTMIDTLVRQLPRLRPPDFWEELGLKPRGYFVTTLHRPGNVDDSETLLRRLHAIADGAGDAAVIFPVHPRTARQLRELELEAPTLHYVAPQGYLEFNFLVQNARAVITDSGGITEEATFLGVPCITLRDTTERPETVTIGTNELVGADSARLAAALRRVSAGEWKTGGIPERWDGKAAERIVEILDRISLSS